MFDTKRPAPADYAPEVAATLQDLMHFAFLTRSRHHLLPHPVYSVLAGRHASRLRGRGLDFEEARQYVAGDDIRNIDWPVTARTGEVYSKVFNAEKERPTFIVVDQSAFLFFGSQKFTKTVVAAHSAAYAIFQTLRRGDRAGGLVFNEEGFDVVMPKRSNAVAQYFLQCVSNRNHAAPLRTAMAPNTALLNEALHRTKSIVSHDYVVTVISDFSGIDQQTRKHLQNISIHNDLLLVHIYDPMDATLPKGDLVLSDGVRQIHWNNAKRNNGADYEKAFHDFKRNITNEFRAYRVPVIFFNTVQRVEEQIQENIGKLTALQSTSMR